MASDTACPEGSPVGEPAVKTAGQGTGTDLPLKQPGTRLRIPTLVGPSLPGDFSRRFGTANG